MKKKELYEKVTRMTYAKSVAAEELSDEKALEAVAIYERYEDLVKENRKVYLGFRFRYGQGESERLYKIEQPEYTFDGVHAPSIHTASIFSIVATSSEGTQSNPIAFEWGMILEAGKYYKQNDALYYCYNGSGNAVFGDLSYLGAFVKVV